MLQPRHISASFRLADTILLGLVTILCLGKTVMLFWGLDKGLEMTDEGFYMLWFNSEHLYAPDWHLNFYYWVQMFFGWVHWDVFNMRLAGLATEVLAIASIVWGLATYCKSKLPFLYTPRHILLLSLATFSVLFMGEHPRMLSYYSLTHLFMSLGTALLLYWLSVDGRLSRKKAALFWALVGFVVASQVIVKFTSAMMLAGIWGIVALLARKQLYRVSAGNLGIAIAAFLGTFVLMFATQVPPAKFWAELLEGQERISTIGYSPINIIFNKYLRQDFYHFAINTLPAIASLALLLVLTKRLNAGLRVTLAVCFSLGVFAAQQVLFPTDFFPVWYFRWLDFFILLIAIGYILIGVFTPRSLALHLVMLVLLALPIVCTFGSLTNMTILLIPYQAAWIGLILLQWMYLTRHLAVAWISWATVYGSIIGSLAIFAYVFLWPTYLPSGLAAPIYQQTVQASKFDKVKLDPPTAEFVAKTYSLLSQNGFGQGSQLLALYDLPGLVYLLGGNSPKVHWYFGEHSRDTQEESLQYACHYIGQIESTDTVFILKPTVVHQSIENCLRQSNLGFPEKYTLVGKVNNTYGRTEAEIWVPNQ